MGVRLMRRKKRRRRGVDWDLWVCEGVIGEIGRALTLDLGKDGGLVSIAVAAMKERAGEEAPGI